MPRNYWKTVVSIYVANTLEDSEMKGFFEAILNFLADDGIAYIAIRRDIKKEGKTSRGTYQINRKLNLPVLVEIKNKFIIYVTNKKELQCNLGN